MKTTTTIEEVDNGYIVRVSEETTETAEPTRYAVVYRTWAEVQQFLDDYYGANSRSNDPEPSEQAFFGEYGSYPVVRR